MLAQSSPSACNDKCIIIIVIIRRIGHSEIEKPLFLCGRHRFSRGCAVGDARQRFKGRPHDPMHIS